MNKEVTSSIKDKLTQIERDQDVQVLYACESGSRMWGFASEDSDYDVRFVYSRGHDHYLSFNVENKRDVIEIMEGEKDYVGFDIRKVMPLVLKSNMAVSEWLRSPYRYRESRIVTEDGTDTDFGTILRNFSQMTFNPIAACYHFSHLARGPKHNKIATDEPLRLKQMLYALRSLLSIRYIESFDNEPPVDFAELCNALRMGSELRVAIQDLVLRKQTGSEKGNKFAAPKTIKQFATEEFERHGYAFKGLGRPWFKKQEVIDDMNDYFRDCINVHQKK